MFVVRDGDRLIVATTTPEPTAGLVFYDLKSALRGMGNREAEARGSEARHSEEEEGCGVVTS